MLSLSTFSVAVMALVIGGFIPPATAASFASPLLVVQGDHFVTVPTETRFRDRPFNATALQSIPTWSDACQTYNLPAYCSYRRQYLFNNATVTNLGASTEYAQLILTPNVALSRSEALNSARMLSRGRMRLNRITEETRERILYDETDPEMGGGFILELFRNNQGRVRRIVFTVVTP
ncbi:hypothetical protein [Spirulina subsalsa]|uniref:hypothetical protein n=1 Tax=Spirulina subsalsa TaxID=54311 RepID=UPI0002D649BC|nr:hypothetical protein [Spirulina subsalsa]